MVTSPLGRECDAGIPGRQDFAIVALPRMRTESGFKWGGVQDDTKECAWKYHLEFPVY